MKDNLGQVCMIYISFYLICVTEGMSTLRKVKTNRLYK